MRILCTILGVLALIGASAFALMGYAGVEGILDVELASASVRHIEMAGVLALIGLAWMVAAAAFRPVQRAAAPANEYMPQPVD